VKVRWLQAEALIVFFKTPRKNEVKTRLALDLGADVALTLYREMLVQIMQTAQTWSEKKKGRLVFKFGHGDPSDWLESGIQGIRQIGADLGQRMQRAMALGLRHARKVAIIGTDSPDLQVETIEKAFLDLEKKDVIFGPCLDGGYYLMACRQLPPTLLWELPWSSAETLQRVCRRCEGHHLTLGFLETKIDIDTLEDLKFHNYKPHLWKK